MHQPFIAHLSAFGRIAPYLGFAAILVGGVVLIISSLSLRSRALGRRIEMVQPRPAIAELIPDLDCRRPGRHQNPGYLQIRLDPGPLADSPAY
jgi:hypothetical protein